MVWIMNNLTFLTYLFGAGLITIVGLLVAYVVRASKKRAANAAKAYTNDDTPPESAPPIEDHLSATAQRIDGSVARVAGITRADRDSPPMVALIGVPGAGASAIADAAALDTPLNLKALSAPHSHTRIVMTAGGAIVDFGDTLLEGDQWRIIWREALRGLRQARPDRPLDAIVFAVPAFAFSDLGDESEIAMGQLGERFGALLGECQALSGLRIPVYFTVSSVDQRPEFAALRDAAKEDGLLGSTIGWSSPHSPEASYDARWVGESLEEMTKVLDMLAVDSVLIDRTGDLAESTPALCGLSQITGDIEKALTRLVSGAMLRSDFADPMMLRGVYLVGGADEARGEPAAFVQDLFSRKIFPETRLVRPAQGYRTRKARQARRWRTASGFAAVGAGVLLFFLATYEDSNDDLRELLNLVNNSVQEFRRLAGQDARQSQQSLERQTETALRTMSELTISDLRTPLAPLSYLTSVEADISQAVAAGLDVVVLRALRGGLRDRYEVIVRSAYTNAPLGINSLEAFVADLEEFDTRTAQFANLRETRLASALSQLSSYAIGFQPPAGFEQNYEIYANALGETLSQPLDRNKLRGVLTQNNNQDIIKVFDGIHQRSDLYLTVDRISQRATWLLRNARADSSEFTPTLTALLRDVNQLDTLFKTPEKDWLNPSTGTFDDMLSNLIGQFGALSFASPALVERVRTHVEGQHKEAEEEILGKIGFMNRPVITKSGNNYELDPLYQRLGPALEALLSSQKLLSAPSSTPSPTPPPGTRFAWSNDVLEQASRLGDQLAEVFVNSSDTIPADLLTTLTSVSRDRVEVRLMTLIDQARQPLQTNADVSGGFTREESRAFALAAPILSKLKSQVDLLGMNRAASRIERSVGQQAQRLLNELTQRLDQEQPYRPFLPGIDAWDGVGNSAPDLFGLGTDAELAGLLASWRNFVQTLANDQVGPILNYLERQGANRTGRTSSQIAFWRDIVETLEAYSTGAPRNALTRLERFMVVDVNGLTSQNCEAKLATVQPGGGYFGERMIDLVTALEDRCRRFSLSLSNDVVTSLTDEFNIALGGRFPFVGVGGGSAISNFDVLDRPADPERVYAFFESLVPTLARIRDEATGAYQVPLTGDQRRFVQNMEVIRQFIQGNAPTFPRAFGYSVSINFRNNRAAEVAADQVIEWTLELGQERLSSFDPPKILIWRQGEPVTFTLRWASNAPNVPAAPPGRPDVSVEGRRIVYSYTDPWALFSFLTANIVSNVERTTLRDSSPNVLKLSIPLSANQDVSATGGTAAEETEIFLQLVVRTLDQGSGLEGFRQPLEVPFFPAEGPL